MNGKQTVTLDTFCEGTKQLLSIEASLNGTQVSQEWAKKIDTEKMKKPASKMVLTGIGDFVYCRKDGVLVVPIGMLKN